MFNLHLILLPFATMQNVTSSSLIFILMWGSDRCHWRVKTRTTQHFFFCKISLPLRWDGPACGCCRLCGEALGGPVFPMRPLKVWVLRQYAWTWIWCVGFKICKTTLINHSDSNCRRRRSHLDLWRRATVEHCAERLCCDCSLVFVGIIGLLTEVIASIFNKTDCHYVPN